MPEVDGSDKKVLPMMTTADMSGKTDPAYREYSEPLFTTTLMNLEKLLPKLGLNYYIAIWDQKATMLQATTKM